jgi:hypothetical protein
MGNALKSKGPKSLLPETGQFVVEFISAKDVPSADVGSESDPYIVAYFVPKVNKPKPRQLSRKVQTLYRLDDPNPIFHSYHNFRVEPPPDSYLRVEIYDRDVLNSDDLIGIAEIPVGSLSREDPQTFHFNFKEFGSETANPNFSFTMRRLFLNSRVPTRKTFFLLRHGESKWNEATKHVDIAGLAHNDHPLDRVGIEQAESLNARWKSVYDGTDTTTERTHFVTKFFEATDIYVSPLTRAVQTSLAALQGHPTLSSKGIHLKRFFVSIEMFT